MAHMMRVGACLLLLAAGAATLRGSVFGFSAAGLPLFNSSALQPIDLSAFCLLLVLVSAAIMPLFRPSRTWRTVQLVLDVAVLGYWNGFFLSTARMVGWAGSGLPGSLLELAAALLMLAMAFLYPVFGRPGHYCLNVCPFGAVQDLAGRIPARKWKLSPALVRHLTTFRRLLWAALMLALWCGAFGRWMDWELFAAFAWMAVPPLVTILAVIFIVISAFVPRAYCRFVCPTGTLLKLSEASQPTTTPPNHRTT